MSEAENEAAARRLFEEVWQRQNYDAIDELVAEEFVLHDPSIPDDAPFAGGREGYRQMAEMGATIVDGEIEIEQLIATDEYVIVRWRQTGEHVGQMGSIEPTGEEVTVTGIEIDRYENGKLAESFQEVGMVPMLTQLGVIPEDLFAPETPPADD